MPAMESYLPFLATATGAVLMPRPGHAGRRSHCARRGAAGRGVGCRGLGACNVVWGAATVLGATALLTMLAAGFGALRVAGAADLAWLGLQALHAARRGDPLGGDSDGATSDLVNVKVGLFWTALVPQYMPEGGGVLLPASMVVTMAGLAFVCLGCFALAAGRLRSALDRPSVSRAVNGAVGGFLVALAAKLATAAR
jgi:threonine/homoserine/homoserine lactone efflux protein